MIDLTKDSRINIKEFYSAVRIYLDDQELKQILLACRLIDGTKRTLTREEVDALIYAVKFFQERIENKSLGIVNMQNRAQVRRLLKFLTTNH